MVTPSDVTAHGAGCVTAEPIRYQPLLVEMRIRFRLGNLAPGRYANWIRHLTPSPPQAASPPPNEPGCASSHRFPPAAYRIRRISDLRSTKGAPNFSLPGAQAEARERDQNAGWRRGSPAGDGRHHRRQNSGLRRPLPRERLHPNCRVVAGGLWHPAAGDATVLYGAGILRRGSGARSGRALSIRMYPDRQGPYDSHTFPAGPGFGIAKETECGPDAPAFSAPDCGRRRNRNGWKPQIPALETAGESPEPAAARLSSRANGLD